VASDAKVFEDQRVAEKVPSDSHLALLAVVHAAAGGVVVRFEEPSVALTGALQLPPSERPAYYLAALAEDLGECVAAGREPNDDVGLPWWCVEVPMGRTVAGQ
jgi:hypothetical protein